MSSETMSHTLFNAALAELSQRDMSTQTTPEPQTSSKEDIEKAEDERVIYESLHTFSVENAKRQLMESQENLHLGGVPRLRTRVIPCVRINDEGVSSEWTGTHTRFPEDTESSFGEL